MLHLSYTFDNTNEIEDIVITSGDDYEIKDYIIINTSDLCNNKKNKKQQIAKILKLISKLVEKYDGVQFENAKVKNIKGRCPNILILAMQYFEIQAYTDTNTVDIEYCLINPKIDKIDDYFDFLGGENFHNFINKKYNSNVNYTDLLKVFKKLVKRLFWGMYQWEEYKNKEKIIYNACKTKYGILVRKWRKKI